MDTRRIKSLHHADVMDRANRYIGDIDELLVDLETGRIVGVIVRTERHRVTLPWERLSFDPDNRRFRVNAEVNEAALSSEGSTHH